MHRTTLTGEGFPGFQFRGKATDQACVNERSVAIKLGPQARIASCMIFADGKHPPKLSRLPRSSRHERAPAIGPPVNSSCVRMTYFSEPLRLCTVFEHGEHDARGKMLKTIKRNRNCMQTVSATCCLIVAPSDVRKRGQAGASGRSTVLMPTSIATRPAAWESRMRNARAAGAPSLRAPVLLCALCVKLFSFCRRQHGKRFTQRRRGSRAGSVLNCRSSVPVQPRP